MTRPIAAFASGLLFAVGLALGGMTRPATVLAFLDFAGAWDPSLLFVMGGAVSVYSIAYWSSRRMLKPVAGDAFAEPGTGRIDARLVSGAALFGAGWGLAGYCPGPVLASLGVGFMPSVLFAIAMLASMWLTRAALQRLSA